jgi:hypothetical protein
MLTMFVPEVSGLIDATSNSGRDVGAVPGDWANPVAASNINPPIAGFIVCLPASHPNAQ